MDDGSKAAASDTDAVLAKAKNDALRLLSIRPRSVEELRDRLARKRYPEEIIGRLIETFSKQKLLDDEKFAKYYSSAKIHTHPQGKKQIEVDLKKKGIAQDLIERTLSGIRDYDETKTAYELALPRVQKMGSLASEKKKARIYGFLKRRGFSNDAIFSAISDIFSPNRRSGDSKNYLVNDDNG